MAGDPVGSLAHRTDENVAALKSDLRARMRMRSHIGLTFVTAALLLARAHLMGAQAPADGQLSESVCNDGTRDAAVRAALRLVCTKAPTVREQPSSAQTIVIGFVGGFASPDDLNHPEVSFAAYLRERYTTGIHAEVFSNHNEKDAVLYVQRLLDTNHDGSLSGEEKKSARIIVYGHSWGASEAAAFAGRLGREAIPVLLTIQVDIISKFRQKPFRIPPNVESAINFYQSDGFLQGRPEIVASDAARTDILGNFRLTYSHRHLNCNNYPWFARTFNKPHHEIENDPNVWDKIASLIDARVFARRDELANILHATGENTSFSACDVGDRGTETVTPARP
jgi:pimeloyl-ACP methyl ester carboxylesterase